jgi:hypothetical protein
VKDLALIAVGCGLLAAAGCSQGDSRQSGKAGGSFAPSSKPVAPSGLASHSTAAQPSNSPSSLAAQEGAGPYVPKDECADLPGFVAFHERLSRAVAEHDAAALATLADPKIALDFGGGGGRDALRRRLADRPGLWDELSELMRLGCAYDHGNAVMPWIFVRAPQDVDAFTSDLVTAASVPLRKAARADAPVVRDLSWELVVRLDPYSAVRPSFVRVKAVADGAEGYAPGDKLRSFVDYRLLARPDKNGGWALTAFVAGD